MRQRKSNVNLPAILFHEGLNYRAYEYFGVHRMTGKYVFRLWSPKSSSVNLVLFYDSGSMEFPMEKITDGGVWEVIIHTLEFLDTKYLCKDPEGVPYLFRITSEYGEVLKNDPFAFNVEKGANGRSVVGTKNNIIAEHKVWDIMRFIFSDNPKLSTSMNICRVDLRKLLKKHKGIGFRTVVKRLVSQIRELNYTHVLVEPVFHSKVFRSGKIIPAALYSVSPEICSQDDFIYFVNKFHNSNIGVILDFDPTYFFSGEYGIESFDGSALFEVNKIVPKTKSKGVKEFDVGKNEVISYLISCAFYWFEKYQIDGLNLCSVGRLLDINFEKEVKDWEVNRYGSTENLVGRFFLKQLCEAVAKEYSWVLMMVDGIEFPTVTPKDRFNIEFDFDFKIERKWFSSFMDYVKDGDDSKFVKSFKYSFILPLVTNEVINTKQSFVDGSSDAYGALRVAKILQMTLPYKKLDFAGDEFGEIKILDIQGGISSKDLTREEMRYRIFIENLNLLYHKEKAFFEEDPGRKGITFIRTGNENVTSFKRVSRLGRECIIVVNFSKEKAESVVLPATAGTKYYKTLFNTNEVRFGGSGGTVFGRYRVRTKSSDFEVILPPNCGLILEPIAG